MNSPEDILTLAVALDQDDARDLLRAQPACRAVLALTPAARAVLKDSPVPVQSTLASYSNIGHRRTILHQRLIEAGIEPQHIWERPNPVDTEAFFRPDAAARHEARQRYGLEGEGPVHLLLGRICARKNQLFALEVLACPPLNHRLLLLGPALQSDQSYVEQVVRRIADLGLDDRVIFQPRYVDDTRQAYHAADSCWVPSTGEGMPNVLLEALVCGVPALVNRDLELHEHITEAVNGFVSPLDSAAFAECAQAVAERLKVDCCATQISAAATQCYGAQPIDAEFARLLSAILDLPPNSAPTAR